MQPRVGDEFECKGSLGEILICKIIRYDKDRDIFIVEANPGFEWEATRSLFTSGTYRLHTRKEYIGRAYLREGDGFFYIEEIKEEVVNDWWSPI